MNVDTESLFGGSLGWAQVTQKQTDIDKSILSRVRQGKEGFSAKSARKAAAASGESPVGIFAASQANAIFKRREAGELDEGQVLGAVGRAFTALKTDFGQDQVDLEGDRLFRDGLQLLQQLAEQATKDGARPANALGRDTSGLKVQKSATTNRRDGFGLAVEKRYGG